MTSSRFDEAINKTRFWRIGRELVVIVAGAGLAVLGLIVFGKPQDPVTSELIVGTSAVAAGLVSPIVEFAWNYIRVPTNAMRDRIAVLERQVQESRASGKQLARQLSAIRAVQLELETNRRNIAQVRSTGRYDMNSYLWSAQWREHRDAVASSLYLQATYVSCRDAYIEISELTNERSAGSDSVSSQFLQKIEVVDLRCAEALIEIDRSLDGLGIEAF